MRDEMNVLRVAKLVIGLATVLVEVEVEAAAEVEAEAEAAVTHVRRAVALPAGAVAEVALVAGVLHQGGRARVLALGVKKKAAHHPRAGTVEAAVEAAVDRAEPQNPWMCVNVPLLGL